MNLVQSIGNICLIRLQTMHVALLGKVDCICGVDEVIEDSHQPYKTKKRLPDHKERQVNTVAQYNTYKENWAILRNAYLTN